jgi:hypothetical protein
MDESKQPTGAPTADVVNSWPLDGPASPCRPPESVSDSMTSATCGLPSQMPLANYDRASHSWSVAQLPLLRIAEDTGLVASPIWPRSGCMLAGSVYELPRPALPTGGTVSGASPGDWPTPQAHDAAPGDPARVGRFGTTGRRPGGWNLNDFVTVEWPTPVSGDAERQSATYARGNPTLLGAVQDWPTPTAGDAKASGAQGYSTESGRHLGTTLTDAAAREWPTPTAQTYGSNQGGAAGRVGPVRPGLSGAVAPSSDANGRPSCSESAESRPAPQASDGSGGRVSSEIGGKLPSGAKRAITPATAAAGLLNPRWVEALQGWPLGWTGLPSAIAGPLLAALRKKPGSRRAPADASQGAPTS